MLSSRMSFYGASATGGPPRGSRYCFCGGRTSRSAPSALSRNAQGIRHEKIIVDAPALGKLERAADVTEHVVVDADLMQQARSVRPARFSKCNDGSCGI